METIEYFSDFLKKIGAPNFLALGIVIIVIWLLISGLRKGLRKRSGRNKESQEDEGNKNKDVSE
jgi:Na+/H+ antiporter NhaD/arsenite permease-like protein